MALAGGVGSGVAPSGRGGGGASFKRVATRGGGPGVELLAAVGTAVAGFGFVAGRLLGSSAQCLGESDSCNQRLMEGFGGGGGGDLRDVWVLLRE